MSIMEHAPILIIVIPLIASFLNIIIGLWRKNLCYPLVVGVLGVGLFLSINNIITVMNNGPIHYKLGGWEPPWGIEYVIDHLSSYISVIILLISLIVAVYSKKSIEKELPANKIVYFYTIYLLLVTGLMGIILSGDLFNIYVFLEIASISGYALIAIGDDRAPLASFNYLIMGTIGACFYLLGVGYLYISTGSLNIADISNLLPDLYNSKVVLTAFAFFIVGIAIKIAFFPLHIWLPDAYTHAPSTVSAFAAATMTKVGLYLMIRIMFTVFNPYFSIELLPVQTILGWMAVGAMLFGCISALTQSDFRRTLCYILIAEVGYIVMGISLANESGFTGAVLHILNDAFMMACLFLVAGAVIYKTGIKETHNFSGLNKKMPLTMAAFCVAALSIIGIPPTAGFFSKWYLILGAIQSQNWVFAGALLLSSLLLALVFFRIIEKIYFTPLEPIFVTEESNQNVGATRRVAPMDEAPLSMLIPILVTAAGIVILGLYSGRIISSIIQFTIPIGF